MQRTRFTVISVARGPDEPAWREQGARSTWTMTLSDSAGTRYLLQLTQPIGGPMVVNVYSAPISAPLSWS